MREVANTMFEALSEKVHDVCYSFYRYEIKNGLIQMNELISKLMECLNEQKIENELLTEINQLLELVQQAIENKDFLIAADVLKHELLGRILRIVRLSA